MAPPVAVLGQPARTPSVSADGRLVVYAAAPPTEDGRTSTIWLRDRASGATTELTPAVEGLRAGNSVHPAISADGCHVVAITEIPYDLFRDDDTGARWDVYQLTTPTCGGTAGAWELVSSRPEDTFGSAAGDDADPDESPAISGSGTIVAYVRSFSATAARDVRSVVVVDRSVALGQQGRTRTVAGTPAQAPDNTFRYHGLHQPSVSDDGRFVAFTSDAASAEAVPTWPDGDIAGAFATSQVYVWDRSSPDPGTAVTVVSRPAAAAANGDAGSATLSHDGRYVAFESTATNLVAGVVLPACAAPAGAPSGPDATVAPPPSAPAAPPPTTSTTTIDETTTTSAGDDGQLDGPQRLLEAPAAAVAPVAVAPVALAPAVVGNTCPAQIYRADRSDGSIDLVSRQAGVPGATPIAADAGGSDPAITYDGSTVVFTTRSRNLFGQQAATTFDATGGEVVVASVDAGALARVSVLADRTSPAPLAQSAVRVSADARTVVFETTAAAAFDGTAEQPDQPHAAIATLAPQMQMADVDLGTAAVGSPSAPYYIGIANAGPTPFVPATITSSNPEFTVVGGTCQLGAAIAAGQSCEVHVVLTPRSGGTKTGVLTVSESGFGATSVQSALAGAGGVGALAAINAGHDFGAARVGATTASVTMQVAVVGSGAVDLSSVDVVGSAAKDFVVTASTCTGVVQVASTCTVDVAFKPTAGGQRVATVRVFGSTGEYAPMIVAGVGEYSAATLATADDRVVAGTRLGVGGSGFPAGVAVTLSWSDGFGGSWTVVTGRDGRFLASLQLAPSERPGQRTLVAHTAKGPTAAADVVVIPRTRN